MACELTLAKNGISPPLRQGERRRVFRRIFQLDTAAEDRPFQEEEVFGRRCRQGYRFAGNGRRGVGFGRAVAVVGYGDLARNGGELGFDLDVCGGHRECRRVGRRTFQFGVAADDRPFREREIFLGRRSQGYRFARGSRRRSGFGRAVAVVGYGSRVQFRLFRLIGTRGGRQCANRRCVEKRGFPKFHSIRGF